MTALWRPTMMPPFAKGTCTKSLSEWNSTPSLQDRFGNKIVNDKWFTIILSGLLFILVTGRTITSSILPNLAKERRQKLTEVCWKYASMHVQLLYESSGLQTWMMTCDVWLFPQVTMLVWKEWRKFLSSFWSWRKESAKLWILELVLIQGFGN